MRKIHIALTVTLALSTAACMSGGGAPPYRLYPPGPHPLGSEQVSTLTGYVQFVDNRDVSSFGGLLELLPGCHVIGTPSHWGEQSPGGASVNATTGRRTFALPMKGGHQYQIEVSAGEMKGSLVRITIKGHESDLRGKKTREFEPVTSPKDIQACREEADKLATHAQ